MHAEAWGSGAEWALDHVPSLLGAAYVGIVIGVWLARDWWTGPVWELMGLIAKAILIATQ